MEAKKDPSTDPASPQFDLVPEGLTWYLLAAIVAVAALLRLVLFVGVARPDIFRYVTIAYHVNRGGSVLDPGLIYGSTRFTMLAPEFLLTRLFGYGEQVIAVWPLVCSLGAVVVAFLIGRELWGRDVGLLAALLMAFAPIEIGLGTQLLPDPMESFFVPLAVWLGILAVTRDRGWRLLALASGASLAVAYFARINVVVFLPMILVLGLFLDRRRWTRSLLSLGGFAAVLGVAAAGFWLVSGDPLADWQKTAAFYQAYQSGGFIPRTSFLHLMLIQPGLKWWLPALAVALFYVALDIARRQGRKERPGVSTIGRDLLLLAWALGFWAYLDIVSPLQGLDSSYRYAEPLVLPIILLCAAAGVALVAALPGLARALPAVALAAVLVWMVHAAQFDVHQILRNRLWVAVRRASVLIPSSDGLPVYVDNERLLLDALDCYTGFRLERDPWEGATTPVNRNARLFTVAEKAFPKNDSFYFLSAWDSHKTPYPGLGSAKIRQLALFESRPSQPLRLYRVRPDATVTK